MWLVWLTFFASVILVIAAVWHFWRRAQGRDILDFVKRPVPWQFDAMFLLIGAVGVISCVPGLFFGQPHWAIDHVWWLISKVSGNAV